MSINSLYLNNFTAFKDLSINLSESINIFIGKNGTGKTHLLKAIYSACEASKDYNFGAFVLEDCFQGNKENINLFHDKNNRKAHIRLKSNKYQNNHTISGTSKMSSKENREYYITIPNEIILNSIYIPVKDMLTHSKGLLAMADKYKEFPFNKTLLNIIKRASQWTLNKPPELAQYVLPILENMIEGQVVIENDEFFIKKHNGQMINFSVEAEGLKKIGLLWRLIMNESITKDSILIWDEPEANLNPDFLPRLVKCLIELSRQKVQIFVSTHNYIFAKYFDVLRQKTDDITYHSLYKIEDDIKCESQLHFDELKHNDIMDAFEKLLDEVYNLE